MMLKIEKKLLLLLLFFLPTVSPLKSDSKLFKILAGGTAFGVSTLIYSILSSNESRFTDELQNLELIRKSLVEEKFKKSAIDLAAVIDQTKIGKLLALGAMVLSGGYTVVHLGLGVYGLFGGKSQKTGSGAGATGFKMPELTEIQLIDQAQMLVGDILNRNMASSNVSVIGECDGCVVSCFAKSVFFDWEKDDVSYFNLQFILEEKETGRRLDTIDSILWACVKAKGDYEDFVFDKRAVTFFRRRYVAIHKGLNSKKDQDLDVCCRMIRASIDQINAEAEKARRRPRKHRKRRKEDGMSSMVTRKK